MSHDQDFTSGTGSEAFKHDNLGVQDPPVDSNRRSKARVQRLDLESYALPRIWIQGQHEKTIARGGKAGVLSINTSELIDLDDSGLQATPLSHNMMGAIHSMVWHSSGCGSATHEKCKSEERGGGPRWEEKNKGSLAAVMLFFCVRALRIGAVECRRAARMRLS